jgi:hypothetical protein
MGRGHGKDAQGSCYPETFASGDADTFAIIHQDQIGMKFDGKSDGVFFASVELIHRRIVDMRGSVNLHPRRRMSNPLLHDGWGFPVL